jgi:hypothetical protein
MGRLDLALLTLSEQCDEKQHDDASGNASRTARHHAVVECTQRGCCDVWFAPDGCLELMTPELVEAMVAQAR